MKTIVVSGARSRIGKTSFALEMQALVPGSRYVKIGCSPGKPDGPKYYPIGTSYAQIASEAQGAPVLIIESNSILKEMTPDVCFFLDGDSPKPSAELARAQADVISGTRVDEPGVQAIAGKLGFPPALIRRMIWLAGARPEAAAAIILIGGKSTRMGKDKSLLPIGGIPAAERLYWNLKPHFDEVFFSSATGRKTPVKEACCICDSVAGAGPLAGIATALSASPYRVNFVIACDIPDFDIPLMRRLLSHLEEYEIAVPCLTPGRPETLFGAYERVIGATAARLIAEGTRKVLALFPLHKTLIVPVHNIEWYANLNTPEDVERFQASGGPGAGWHAKRNHNLKSDSSI